MQIMTIGLNSLVVHQCMCMHMHEHYKAVNKIPSVHTGATSMLIWNVICDIIKAVLSCHVYLTHVTA